MYSHTLTSLRLKRLSALHDGSYQEGGDLKCSRSVGVGNLSVPPPPYRSPVYISFHHDISFFAYWICNFVHPNIWRDTHTKLNEGNKYNSFLFPISTSCSVPWYLDSTAHLCCHLSLHCRYHLSYSKPFIRVLSFAINRKTIMGILLSWWSQAW